MGIRIPDVPGIHVTVGMDKPLACLNVVLHLNVDKGQVLRSGILDTYKSTATYILYQK